jgi:uncharacterized spore protein YtfJ
MIDYVVGGEFMNVTSNKGATPYINTGNPITGMVSYDGTCQSMKVYDGNGWQTIGGGSGTVNLSYDAISILKWAQKKMLEEAERNKLAETNPTIKDLIEQIKQKEEQISIVQALIKEEEKV